MLTPSNDKLFFVEFSLSSEQFEVEVSPLKYAGLCILLALTKHSKTIYIFVYVGNKILAHWSSEMCRESIFFFQERFWKIKARRDRLVINKLLPLCRSAACPTIPPWWLMNLSTTFAQSSCRSTKKCPRVNRKIVPLLSGSPAWWCFVPQSYLFQSSKALSLCLLHWFVLLSGRAFWSVIPSHGHPTFKEMCWHPPGTHSWNFLFSAPPGNYVPCSRLSGCAALKARMLFFPPPLPGWSWSNFFFKKK